MIYEKEYKIIPQNHDFYKITKFLENNFYVDRNEKGFVNEYHFTKNKEDDFQNEYEIDVLIKVNADSIGFHLESINPDNVSIGMKKYMKLLTLTMISIFVDDDYKEEEWQKFYDSIKKRKTTFTIASFVLDILDLLG